ncbi:MAG: hypothetical protein ABI604_01255 [Nitrospirota bacterium]
MASQIRLELGTTNSDLQDGLQARIHDPLWMLARQWQFGEFKCEDAGSATSAHVVADTTVLTRYCPGPSSLTQPVHAYVPSVMPLETLVEGEVGENERTPDWRRSVETGRHLLRLLHAGGAGQSRALWLNSGYLLAKPSNEQRQRLDCESLQFLQVVGGRALDGVRLHTRLAALHARNALGEFFQEPPFNQITGNDQPKVIQAITSWLTWHDTFFHQNAALTAWIPERMEYEFAVSGKTAEGEVVLAAPEYFEGTLDWFSFVVRPGQTLGAIEARTPMSRAFLPAPVTFHGMPSSRFWEFEDGTVNLAQINAAPHDLARLLLVKFALEYSNDWFAVPIELPVGSLCQIRALVVTNTFGERILIPHTTQADGSSSSWQMFMLAQDSQRLFFLPPVLGDSLHSAPSEEVLFLRDEMANVAWGVERIVESAAGRPLDRYEAYQEAQQKKEQEGAAPAAGGTDGETLTYRLGTTVPEYWIPLLPVQDGASIRLKRGVIPEIEAGEVGRLLEPLGRILEPGRELLLQDEEVPREGVRVTRAYQYARWIDGSTYLWIGRRKQPGRGEGSSGLRFDVAQSPSSSTRS